MYKNVLIVSLFIIFITSMLAIILVFVNNRNTYSNGNGEKVNSIIANKEMAKKIGKIILEEYFPDVFKNKEMTIEAEENNGVWKVYNVIEREKKLENGNIALTMGGEYYVVFRKSTCEIIALGVND